MEVNIAELFEYVDASQVELQTVASLDVERIKQLTLSKLEAKPGKKHAVRKLFLAAAIAATLAATALAYAEFRKYENPGEMLDGFFGDREIPSVLDHQEAWGQVPDNQRVALDPDAAAYVEPFIAAVEQTVTEGDTRLTVHGNLYDSVTGCGILYYTLENPRGIEYTLYHDGEIDQIPVYSGTRHGYTYLLKEKSTEKKLEIAEYYVRGPHDEENYIEISLMGDSFTASSEEEFDLQMKAVRVPLDDGGGMEGLIGGGVRISPIGIHLDLTKMDGVPDTDSIHPLKIRFTDGEDYILEDDFSQNYMFAAASDSEHLTIPFNRLVNLSEVQSVEVNGQEITGFQPIPEGERWRQAPYIEDRGSYDTLDSPAGDRITYNGVTFIPGTLQYAKATKSGIFTCRIESKENVEKFLPNDYFSPYDAGLQCNQLGRWQVTHQEKHSLDLTFYFTDLSEEGSYLKFWFEDGKADPRLNKSTENLVCAHLIGDAGAERKLAEGNIVLSDLGMIISYGNLEVRQGDIPKDLIISFKDGSSRVISSFDEDILDGFFMNSQILRGHQGEKTLWITFFEPMEAENVESIQYAGHIYR